MLTIQMEVMASSLPTPEFTWLLFWWQGYIIANLGLSVNKPFKEHLRKKKKMSPRFSPFGKIKKVSTLELVNGRPGQGRLPRLTV